MRRILLTLLALSLALSARAQASRRDPSPEPAPATAFKIAVFPLENLSGVAAPLPEIREALRRQLESRWVPMLDEEALQRFMEEHRLRYVGGLAREMGRALADETGVRAVLVCSLDLYQETAPPKMALTVRLVSTGDDTGILWMETAIRTGDDFPGFLGLGQVRDPELLRDELIGGLAESLSRHLSQIDVLYRGAHPMDPGPRRFRPRNSFHSGPAGPGHEGGYRVAVLPFLNGSMRPYASDLLMLQTVRYLAGSKRVEVLEPGVVREALLRGRVIQQEGLSVPQAGLLRLMLEVDLVISGEVVDFVEPQLPGEMPELDFSALVFDTQDQRVIWSSNSHGRGDDRVFFFGAGTVPTALGLASEMARALIASFLPTLEATS